MAVKYAANVGEDSISIDGEDLTGAFGAGSEFALVIPNHGTPSIAWQTVFSAPVGSITVLLEASLNGSDWFTIDTSTSISGEIRTISGSYRFLRINNSAVTVGAGITLTASFVYSNTTINGLKQIGVDLIQGETINVTSAQILALNTTPITVVPAITGYMLAPSHAHIFREAGTPYTANGATSLVVRFTNGVGGIRLPSFDLTVLTDAGPFTVIARGPANSNSTSFSGTDFSSFAASVPLVLHAIGGNPTVGTGGLYVTVWYYKFPNARL